MIYRDLGELEHVGVYDNGQITLTGSEDRVAVSVDPRPMMEELREALDDLEDADLPE